MKDILFEATGCIEDKFLKEAGEAKPPRFSHFAKRIAAAAAIFVICGIFFLSSAAKDDPLFAVKVHAADTDIQISSGAVSPYSSFFSQHPKDACPEEWKELDLFSITVTLDNPPKDLLNTAYLVVEYGDHTITDQTADPHIVVLDKNIISAIHSDEPEKGYQHTLRFQVYGWFYEPTNVTVHLYRANEGVSDLLLSQAIQIQYKNRYIIDGKSPSDSVGADIKNKSTEQLVESLMDSSYLKDLMYASSSDVYNSIIVSHNKETLLELQTRSDAGSAMLRKLQSLLDMQTPDDTWEGIYHRSRKGVLMQLLSLDVYYEQLTDAEKDLFEALTGFRFDYD